MARGQIKQYVNTNSERMGRIDMANYFGKSLPWVDKAWKSGLIPPPIKIGSPMWVRSSVDAWIARLQQEAIEAAKEQKTA